MNLFTSAPARRLRQGSLLLEAVIAMAIFAIVLTSIGLVLVVGEHQTLAAGYKVRGTYLAEQQLEILRQMHTPDTSAAITPGTHGLILGQGGLGWMLSGTSASDGPYQTSVEITALGTDWLGVRSNVHWQIDRTRSGSVVLSTYLTHWDRPKEIGDWSQPQPLKVVTDGGTPNFRKIAVSGQYAFITGSVQDGGRKALYVFDCSSNPPTEAATGFNIAASAEGIAIAGNRLYLATDEPGRQVQVYDISSPSTLNETNLVASYGLPNADLRAVAIAVYGTTVFVGTNDNTVDPQFYALRMSESGPMTLLDSLRIEGSVVDMSLRDGYGYLATSSNFLEVQVVDLFDPTQLSKAPGIGMVYEPGVGIGVGAQTIAVSGTSALIGRLSGATFEELSLYDLESSPVPPPLSDKSVERGADVNSLAILPGTQYAFGAEKQILDEEEIYRFTVLDLVAMMRNQNPVLFSYNDLVRPARGVAYATDDDPLYDDLLYVITDKDLLIFGPG
ncbi:MAG: hypothetical protein PHZ00_05295 [Candidatus Peribacteraceae bacterium]|nr:hypothetical protein [Candidatus Peribacteraceae bacterium]